MFTSPLCIAFFAVSAIFALFSGIFSKLRILWALLSAVFVVVGGCIAFVVGAALEELLIAVVLVAVIGIFAQRGEKK